VTIKRSIQFYDNVVQIILYDSPSVKGQMNWMCTWQLQACIYNTHLTRQFQSHAKPLSKGKQTYM
jgi:hypothetical protein